jgi:hypothetical protein
MNPSHLWVNAIRLRNCSAELSRSSLRRATVDKIYGMSELTKKPGVAFWATIVLVVAPLLFPLSFGPACWWFKDSELDLDGGVVVNIAPNAYWPMGWLAQNGPESLSDAINWYATLKDYWIHVPVNRAGDRWIVLVKKND